MGKGAIVHMLSQRDGWACIEIQDPAGKTHVGWVDAAQLSLVIR